MLPRVRRNQRILPEGSTLRIRIIRCKYIVYSSTFAAYASPLRKFEVGECDICQITTRRDTCTCWGAAQPLMSKTTVSVNEKISSESESTQKQVVAVSDALG